MMMLLATALLSNRFQFATVWGKKGGHVGINLYEQINGLDNCKELSSYYICCMLVRNDHELSGKKQRL